MNHVVVKYNKYYYTVHIFLLYKSNTTIWMFFWKFCWQGRQPGEHPKHI